MNNWVTAQDIAGRLSLDDSTLQWKLDLGDLFGAIPSLRCRKNEARNKIVRVWSGFSHATWQGDTLAMPPNAHGLDEKTDLPISESATLLDAIASRPLSPKELCGVLRISKQERLRWTKDGRLKPSGTLTFKAAQPVTVPTYSAHLVTELSKDLRKIALWRKMDAVEKKESNR